jgi:hypothetical protein
MAKKTLAPGDSLLRSDGRIDNDRWRAMSRRRFVQAIGASGSVAAQGLLLGSGLSSWASRARADVDPNANEHYYIFVELAGGMFWPMGVDGRDPALIKAQNAKSYHPMDVRKPVNQTEFGAITADGAWTQENGQALFMAYDSQRHASWEQAVTVGKTTAGLPYGLGFCAESLHKHVDDIAVVRGVMMAGNFHGKGNSSDDIWSGTDKGDQPHVASVLAALLERTLPGKPLDNLVLENAFFPENPSSGAKAAVRTDGRTLGSLLASFAAANSLSAFSPAERFDRYRKVGEAIIADAGARLGAEQAQVYRTYIDTFGPALDVQGKLLKLGDQLKTKDISLDLGAQFDLALTLMEAGLSRVITLCMGAPNADNRADSNGLFDAHTGLYTKEVGGNSTQNCWEQIERAMGDVAAFVDRLNKLDAAHPLKGKVTVLISSEFGRQGNTNGNERGYAGSDGFVQFGAGHNFRNNNYILFGKGVRGGAWVGQSSLLSQVRYDVDFGKLASTPLDKLYDNDAKVFIPPADEKSVISRTSEPPAEIRGFAARDLVRTALATGGFDDQYDKFYSRSECKDARLIKPVLG